MPAVPDARSLPFKYFAENFRYFHVNILTFRKIWLGIYGYRCGDTLGREDRISHCRLEAWPLVLLEQSLHCRQLLFGTWLQRYLKPLFQRQLEQNSGILPCTVLVILLQEVNLWLSGSLSPVL